FILIHRSEIPESPDYTGEMEFRDAKRFKPAESSSEDNSDDENGIGKISFLDFPNEIFFRIYAHFDLASRRKIRMNKRLEEIEMATEYRYKELEINVEESGVTLKCDGSEMEMDHSEIKEEFERLGKNTHFENVVYKSTAPADQDTSWKTKFLKATRIEFDFLALMDEDLPYMVKNKEKLIVVKESDIGEDGLYWLYKKMSEDKLDVKFVLIESDDVDTKWEFMRKINNLDDEEDDDFDDNEDVVRIREGKVRVVINGATDRRRDPDNIRFVSFQIVDENKKSAENEEEDEEYE
ncbi:hypothetical protein PFISCL1PPCAC_5458, partial [Pristionchus fissidentatus]